MNRKRQITVKKTLPLTTNQFLSLKNRVKTHVILKEKYRYGDQFGQLETGIIERSLSEAPSSLESSAYLANEKKRAQSIGPLLRIRKPTFSQTFHTTEHAKNKAKIQNFNLQRFRKIIHLSEQNICRTCEVDKRFRPKLFKRHY